VTLTSDEASPSLAIETAYPPELIASVLDVKGPAWLCDEIRRDEDPTYVSHFLAESILSYVAPESLSGRLLELGSGAGASSLNLRRLLPELQVVGVELLADHVGLARSRAAFHGMDSIEFIHNPDGSQLPDGLGEFDFVILSAVYEHLLPVERRSLMPQVGPRADSRRGWIRIKAGTASCGLAYEAGAFGRSCATSVPTTPRSSSPPSEAIATGSTSGSPSPADRDGRSRNESREPP